MSRLSQDIDALRAMAVSRMSPASIAKVLGRSEAWVERQLDLLVDAQGREAAVFAAGVQRVLTLIARAGKTAALLGRSFARAAVGRARRVDLAVVLTRAGLVERVFLTHGGRGHGAAVEVGDGRLAFVDTPRALEAGQRVTLGKEPGRFVVVPEAA